MVHYHGTTVALESHTASGLERLYDQCWVAKKIHHGMAAQKYDLPEVQIIVGIWRLVKDLGDAWPGFSV